MTNITRRSLLGVAVFAGTKVMAKSHPQAGQVSERKTMFHVKFYKGEYIKRQQAANADGAVAYVEHHFNSDEASKAGYACVVVGSNASNTSRNWGRWYAKAIAQQFGGGIGGDQGILVGGYHGRGDGNLKHTRMPAVLLEPLFASKRADRFQRWTQIQNQPP
jgi:N-acetylmuramoyl-L-alanine amidase